MSPFEASLFVVSLFSTSAVYFYETGRRAAGYSPQPFASRRFERATSNLPLLVSAVSCGLICIVFAANFYIQNVSPSDVASAYGDASARGSFRPEQADVARLDADIGRIESYLASVGRTSPKSDARPMQFQAGGLPDVETMIERLESRLEADTGDVEGWRTLGWSYLNTGRPSEALRAYEKALALAPQREDLKQELSAAQAASRNGAGTELDDLNANQTAESSKPE